MNYRGNYSNYWCKNNSGNCHGGGSDICQEYTELKAKYRCLCLKAAQLLQERNEKKLGKQASGDEDAVFLRGLYPFINTLSTQKKLNLRMAFQELMYKYAYNDQLNANQMLPAAESTRSSKDGGKGIDPTISQSEEEDFYESMLPYFKSLTPEKKLLFRGILLGYAHSYNNEKTGTKLEENVLFDNTHKLIIPTNGNNDWPLLVDPNKPADKSNLPEGLNVIITKISDKVQVSLEDVTDEKMRELKKIAEEKKSLGTQYDGTEKINNVIKEFDIGGQKALLFLEQSQKAEVGTMVDYEEEIKVTDNDTQYTQTAIMEISPNKILITRSTTTFTVEQSNSENQTYNLDDFNICNNETCQSKQIARAVNKMDMQEKPVEEVNMPNISVCSSLQHLPCDSVKHDSIFNPEFTQHINCCENETEKPVDDLKTNTNENEKENDNETGCVLKVDKKQHNLFKKSSKTHTSNDSIRKAHSKELVKNKHQRPHSPKPDTSHKKRNFKLIEITTIKEEDYDITPKDEIIEEYEATPIKDMAEINKDKITPIKEEDEITPIKEEGELTPIKEEDEITQIKEENKITPIKEEDKITQIKEENKITPIKEEDKITPIKKEGKRAEIIEPNPVNPYKNVFTKRPSILKNRNKTKSPDKEVSMCAVMESKHGISVSFDATPKQDDTSTILLFSVDDKIDYNKFESEVIKPADFD